MKVFLGDFLLSPVIKKLASKNIFQTTPSENLIESSLEYSIEHYNKSLEARHAFVEKILAKINFGQLPTRYKDASHGNSERILLGQRMAIRYGNALTFADFCQQVLGKSRKISFVLSAPAQVIDSFESFGFQMSRRWSKFLWTAERLGFVCDGIISYFKNIIKSSKDYFTLMGISRERLPETFWILMGEGEFSNEANCFNIEAYTKNRSLPFLKGSGAIFLSREKQKLPIFDSVHSVYVGRNFICTPGRPRMKFLQLIRILRETTGLLGFIGKTVIYNRWWHYNLLGEVFELPRMEMWFRAVTPKHIAWTVASDREPLWMIFCHMYQCQTWQVFYSKNTIPIKYRGDASSNDLTRYHYLYADNFAVWDSQQGKWLEHLGYPSEKILVCGPIIFSHYPKIKPRKSEAGNTIISVFDVPPFSNRLILSHGEFLHYHSYSVAVDFLDKVLKCTDEVFNDKYTILLKAKGKSPTDDGRYWSYLDALLKRRKNIKLLHPSLSPLFMISEVNAAIGKPYTSPVDLAFHYKIPACYFDPTGKVAERESYDQVAPPLLDTQLALKLWLKGLLNQGKA